MTAYTLTKNSTLRDFTVAGGYSARSGGDSVANTNGWSLTIDQDTQYGYGAPAFAAATAGSLGSITQTAASGGDILIDATKVWLIPFNTGSGTLVPSLAGVTISGITCNTIAVYTALTAAPATTGASGWLKVTNASGTLPSSGSFTSDGFTYTITGAAVRGWIEIVGDDAATMTLVRLGKFQVRGAYYDIGTATGTRSTTYNVPNNGKQLFLPALEVQGATWTITGATWANGFITYTTSATHDMLVGQPVSVTGASPSGYNVTDLLIVAAPDITDTTFSVAAADPGTYTSGGSAIAYEQYPCAGTLPATAAAIYDEDTRRGKVFWNTNATTSLTAPLGYVRFGHDGTNSTGGFCPPAGRNIRIPNIFFTNCTTAARNQNVLPNATLATRYDFTTTGAGIVDIDKATMCWYLSVVQAYQCITTNSNFMSQIAISEVPTEIVIKNAAVGQEAAVVAVSPIVNSLNPGGTTMHNFVGTMAATTGTGGAFLWSLFASASVTAIDCVGWLLAFRTGTSKDNSWSACGNLVLKRFHTIGHRVNIANCPNMQVLDTKYTDTTGLRQTTQGWTPILPNGPLSSGVISGFKYVGYRAQQWASMLTASGSLRGPLKVRNLGTLAAPLDTGDGPYYDKSWSRTTTVCTVTHVAHKLIVGDNIVVYWVTSTSAIAIGSKTVATVPTADTFTFTCTSGGDATGTLSYYVCNMTALISASAGANAEAVTLQRVYPKFQRGSSSPDNSNNGLVLETSYAIFDPTQASLNVNVALNLTQKFSGAVSTGQQASSQYGATWVEGPMSALPDTLSYTWARAAAVVTLTTGSGYHNQQLSTSAFCEVTGSSDEAALNNGYYPLVVPATAGDVASKFRVTGYAVGGTTGSATANFETGRISILMNEGTDTHTDYHSLVAGNAVDLPKFTGTGLLRMPNVGDQIVFETPYFVRGHTGFMTTVPLVSTATIANFHIEYQIDTGSGYGAWKTAYRRTATSVADGTAGAATVTGLAGTSADNWIANGDIVQTSTIGVMNRVAKVVSGGGTTTLTMNKNHNTTFTNVPLDVFGLPNENASINYDTGFKLKIRFTTIIAGTGATNTLGTLTLRTLTTAASRQVQFPLDVITLTLTGLVSGSDVVVRSAGTGTILASVDSNAGTTWGYVYETPAAIDIDVIKPGYVPFPLVRNYTPAASDSSLPVAQQVDRNYS